MSEIISKKLLTNSYVSTDLAVIIPTKDRPAEVKRLLKSIAELDCKIGRIIIIATGMDIQNVVMSFVNRIPVEYYSSEPGQIKQRNKGISLLDDSTKLVATMDDDTLFHKTSSSEMINFWNSVETETAGVGFNIVNQVGHQHTWLRGIFGVSVPEPGRVLKNGLNISICNVKHDIRSEWLNGGATTWRQDILQNYPHEEICSKWAVCEDLIFSYPIGKIYPLYISKDANVELDNLILYTENAKTLIYKGKTQFIWGAYFVIKNSDMSIFRYMYRQMLSLITTLIKGIINKNKFFNAVGILQGFLIVTPALIANKNFTKLIKKHT